jgi:sugar lactone lactonase YvrE
VSTVAGTGKQGFADGPLMHAQFNMPEGICFDEIEQSLLVCDLKNDRLRRVSLLQGK